MISTSESALFQRLHAFIEEHRPVADLVFRTLQQQQRRFLLRSDLLEIFDRLCAEHPEEGLERTPLQELFLHCQEMVVDAPWVAFKVRLRIAHWSFYRLHLETLGLSQLRVEEFLRFKERLVTGSAEVAWCLEFDMGPFTREQAKLREPSSIGRGATFMNRRLSSQLFENAEEGRALLLRFLRLHRLRDQPLLLEPFVSTVTGLVEALRQALARLSPWSEIPWSEVAQKLGGLGFLPGWGATEGRVRETMAMLLDILEAPSPNELETFLGRIPMISSVAILSPHGWFSQAHVLGRPDTGGQVVYILDQVRALEREMRERLADQGLTITPQVVVVTRLIPESDGTTCGEPRERIEGTEGALILRVPFRTQGGEVVPQWISRFEVWPYLEQYALDVERDLLAELGGLPDLLIGNYSDGNLVATLLSERLGVTQCSIAHALEKTKYLYSDLYWKDNEVRYHFACQFTADLLAMNAADIIITSTYQEIAGTAGAPGQYESYQTFTLPALYRVVHGIDVFHPKFNIVSPGADPDVYFSSREPERRLTHLQPELEALVFGDQQGPDRRGHLRRRDRPLLFSMARLDRIKNLAGLLEWYGSSPALREEANLLLVAGHVDPDRSGDEEEREQAHRMHGLMDRYELDGEVRWVGVQLDRALAGELYRFVADWGGAFVQPAWFEAFGLTVIEAMASGLPTFATCFGGPLEIIEDDISGYHIDPNHGEAASAQMAAFFAACRADPAHWDRVSEAALKRVAERYTWARYAGRLMTMARVYGFWRFATELTRRETRRYLEMFYALQFRPLAEAVPRRGG